MSKYLEDKRTIFSLDNKDANKIEHLVGLIIYIIVFVIFIPYVLIQYKYWTILSGYIPNLDLIATTIGYHGGPGDSFIWKYLYNPETNTITGYLSSNLINLFALLGVTYLIAHYTFINNNIYKGWSRAFIILPMTYFIPGNIVVYYMNKVGKYLNKYFLSNTIIHYLLVVIFGLILCILFILLEAGMIDLLTPKIFKILEQIY